MILSLVFLPIIMSVVCWFSGKKSKEIRNIVASVTVISEMILAVLLCTEPSKCFSLNLVGQSGLFFEMDGFRKVYCIVIAFMWLMTMLLGNQYFSHYADSNRYYFFNLMTLGATMGVFLSGDLFTALVFFEVMSFTSYTWVIQEETEGAIRAANTYLAVAVIGGLTALMGLFLLQDTLGTTRISLLYELSQICPDKKTLYIAGACILFGFGAKAGMFPLHIWLPKAHPVAPAPASALLSGILTKSGIFGILAITCNMFRYDTAWGNVILILGTITMVLGAVLALLSVDLKRTLACSSVSQIGFILIGIGLMPLLGSDNALASRGTILHMMNHSLFKLVLFLCAAVVYMNLHKLDLNDIRGFGKRKPLLKISFLFGALGIGGIPLFSGYISKTLLHEGIVEYTEILEESGKSIIGMKTVEILFLISGGITVAYMTKLFVCLFVESNNDHFRQKQFNLKNSYMNKISTFALLTPAVLIPFFGSLPGVTMNKFAETCMDFFHGSELEKSVSYFTWTNLKGSLISITIGLILYFGFVRTVLMKQKNGQVVYVNRWPKKFDLEELFYRPLILKWLPSIFGWLMGLFGNNVITGPIARGIMKFAKVLAHALSDLLDAFVLLLRKTLFRESDHMILTDITDSTSFQIGLAMDKLNARLGKEKAGSTENAKAFYEKKETYKEMQRKIQTTLSFALLAFCFTAVLIFAYVMFIY